jgi:hypothetical protein
LESGSVRGSGSGPHRPGAQSCTTSTVPHLFNPAWVRPADESRRAAAARVEVGTGRAAKADAGSTAQTGAPSTWTRCVTPRLLCPCRGLSRSRGSQSAHDPIGNGSRKKVAVHPKLSYLPSTSHPFLRPRPASQTTGLGRCPVGMANVDLLLLLHLLLPKSTWHCLML